jgi:hypothetical protein
MPGSSAATGCVATSSATALANQAVNRLGCAGLARLTAEAAPDRVVPAIWLAGELLGLEARFAQAEALPADPRLAAQAELRALLEAATVDVLPSLTHGLDQGLGAALAQLRPGWTDWAPGRMPRWGTSWPLRPAWPRLPRSYASPCRPR